MPASSIPAGALTKICSIVRQGLERLMRRRRWHRSAPHASLQRLQSLLLQLARSSCCACTCCAGQCRLVGMQEHHAERHRCCPSSQPSCSSAIRAQKAVGLLSTTGRIRHRSCRRRQWRHGASGRPSEPIAVLTNQWLGFTVHLGDQDRSRSCLFRRPADTGRRVVVSSGTHGMSHLY